MHESKRSFLKMLSALGVTGAAPLSMNLLTMGSLASQSTIANAAGEDYKALVCIFLNGGNDSHNMIVPYDNTSYTNYYNKRSSIAIPQSELLPLQANNIKDGRIFGFHPSMPELQNMFNNGKLAVLANVGPLIAPTTKTMISTKKVVVPVKLFSHNDQQATWQSSFPEGGRSGYGGRMADILQANNSNALFTAISVSGNASIFLAGKKNVQYPVNSAGIVKINATTGSNLFGSTSAPNILRALMTNRRSNFFQQDIHTINNEIFRGDDIAIASLAASMPVADLPSNLINSSLAKQLKMVSQLISARRGLGAKREVFFVSLGGFDTHDFQLTDQAELLTQVSQSMQYFYDNLVTLGLENNVISFTASDFGRTLQSNGDGSDHGWGAHHLIMGGAIKGKNIYGTWPTLAINGPDDIGSGRLIPTTSVEQYLADFATWLGVPNGNLLDVFPNLANFNVKKLGMV